MRTLRVFLGAIFALVFAHHVAAATETVAHPMVTPAPFLDKLEMRQSDDCDEASVRDCEEKKWSILFRAPVCRSASDRGPCSCSAAEAQSACYLVYCQTAPENVSSKVESECGSVSRASEPTSKTPTSVRSTTSTTTSTMSTGGASVGGLLDSRVLLTIGGLLAIEL